MTVTHVRRTTRLRARLLQAASPLLRPPRALDLATPVLLDPDGATGRDFGVTGTPQAVLVGPDGRIAAPLARGADAVFRLLDNRLSRT